MKTLPPKWFGEALAMAQHKDKKRTWPWYGRLFHRLFVKCPCCKMERANEQLQKGS